MQRAKCVEMASRVFPLEAFPRKEVFVKPIVKMLD
jgi:hypothetical protein